MRGVHFTPKQSIHGVIGVVDECKKTATREKLNALNVFPKECRFLRAQYYLMAEIDLHNWNVCI